MKTWPVIGAGVVALLVSVAVYIFEPRFISAISLQSYDTLMKSTAVPPQSDQVIIVDIDDSSLASFGQWPWPRFLMARLTERLWDAGAVVVAYDIVFAEPDRASPSVMKRTWEQIYGDRINVDLTTIDGGDFDERFAQALARGRSVLGCFMVLTDEASPDMAIRADDAYRGYYYERGTPQRRFLLQARDVIAPITVLQNAASGVAFFNTIRDQDNIVRKTPMVVAYGPRRIYPSLSLESLRYALDVPRYAIVYDDEGLAGVRYVQLKDLVIPTDPEGRLVLNFRSDRFPRVSAKAVIDGTADPAQFRDKIVLIGTSAAGLRDLFATPLHNEFPGVEVHATAVDNMMAGDMLREPHWIFYLNLAAMLLGGLALTFVCARSRALVSVMVVLAFIAAAVGVSLWLLKSLHLVVIPSVTIFAWLAAYITVTILKYWQKEVVDELNARLRKVNEKLEQEIVERKRIEVELRKARNAALAAAEAKSEFLANMSHEIRTPMNGVIGMTELALKTAMTERQRGYLNKISISARALLRIINDILDFSKIEAGKLDIERTAFSLQDVLEDMADLFGEQAVERNLEFVIDRKPGIPDNLIGDPLRVRQVLINLLGNAMKFTEKGQVVLLVEPLVEGEAYISDGRERSVVMPREDEAVVGFSVRDTGIGISEKKIKDLFEAFSQADGSTTRKYGGTGLGLTISRTLVQLMFGQMHVESQLGEGSCFSFQLPFALADGQEPEPRLWPEESQHGALAVIPNETTAAAFVRLLEQQQMACRTVRSVEEAQSLLKQGGTGKTDIVFVDQAETEDLPAAVEQLRACTGNGTLPVVLLIASDTFHASEKARKIDVNGYLTKPVKKSALLSLLRRVYELEARPAGKKLPRGRQHDWSSIKGIKVILAEDNPINQEVALENLRSVGVVADIAQDGMQVMKMVSEGNYDAVLMDIQMPDMDGFEATRKVRQSESVHHGIPIIAMTAHAMSGDREKCLDAGMNGYVTKPIDPEKMFAELDRCVAQARTAALGVESAASREEVPQSPAETVHDRMGIEPIAPAPEMTYTEDGFPELEGFDVRAGLLRVRNNQELYTRLLTDFARREGDICKHIRAAWEDRQVDQVRKQAHMLKGTAGNLAATALHQAARNLESALKDKHFQDVEVRITQLQEAMSQTMDSIDWLAAMQQEDESDAGAVAEMTIDVEKQMQTLYNLLQKGSVDAETVMQSLQTAFEKAQVRDQARKLEQQMADFDYTGACETLENMAKKMGYTLIGQNK